MNSLNNVFAFCNQKGGVGKTTTVINLGTCIAQLGFKVLIIDADPQGNATSGFGIDKNDVISTIYDNIIGNVLLKDTIIKDVIKNADLVPSNAHLAGAEVELINIENREFFLRNLIKLVKSDYDFIFIDCPPSLGLLTINALVAADKLMIPLQCEYYALEGLGQLLDTFNLVKERLNHDVDLFGVIMTMADYRTNLTNQILTEVKEFFQKKVFSAVIPRSIKLSEAPGFGKPGIVYAPHSQGVARYKLLAEEFLERLQIRCNYQNEDEENSDAESVEKDEQAGSAQETVIQKSEE
ncbi:MAG: AAA family ATPase [Candidatus Omnitrophica bacterium]|nr:AAA family ATPase [Candidatus Omnitrophota bacterium]